MELSKRALEILQTVGWTPERKISVEKYQIVFDQTRQEYSETVLDFLARFGDLNISYSAQTGYTVRFYVDPIEASDSLDGLNLDYYRKRTGKKLCFIGGSNQSDLLMDVDGIVYVVFDKYVDLIAKSGAELISYLCNH